MLLMRFTTTKILTLKQEQLIKEKVEKLFQDKNVMIHIEDNQVMYFHNQELQCMMIECQFFNDDKCLDELLKKLMIEITNITEIPLNHQYLSMHKCYFLG